MIATWLLRIADRIAMIDEGKILSHRHAGRSQE